jgi:hypothetical protein
VPRLCLAILAPLSVFSSEDTRYHSQLRTLNGMKTGCLILDVRRVDLSDLAATRQRGSFIVGDTANEHVSPSRGDASLVVGGEECVGDVP